MTLDPKQKSKPNTKPTPKKPRIKTKLTKKNYDKLRKQTGGGFVRTHKTLILLVKMAEKFTEITTSEN